MSNKDGGKQNRILHCALVLLIITAIAGLLLAGVNMLTKDAIKENNARMHRNTLSAAMPKADTLVPVNPALCGEYGVKGIYIAQSGGKDIGYCIQLLQAGYNGDIDVVVGIETTNMTVTGVRIAEIHDMAGVGAYISSDRFTSQYVGKQYSPDHIISIANYALPNAAAGSEFSAKAVTAAVNRAMAVAVDQQRLNNIRIEEERIAAEELAAEEARIAEEERIAAEEAAAAAAQDDEAGGDDDE